jgi:hypothetical protein
LDLGDFPPYTALKLIIERPEDTLARLALKSTPSTPLSEFVPAPPTPDDGTQAHIPETSVLAAINAADVEAAALGKELIFPNM